MASSNDLIKYVTQEVVRYIDTPKQHRKEKVKENFSSRWFGMIPFSIKMLFKK